MNFRPELAAAVMAGRKTVTRRACSTNPLSPWWQGDCAKKVGNDYAVCPGRGKVQIGRVKILGVRRERFDPEAIDDAEARREGFADAKSFRETWVELHGGLAEVDCWRIEFEVVR